MKPTLDEYWEAVQRRVCVKCIDSDGHGNCLLSGEDECGLILHFPKIVETVLSVKSDSLDPYIEALRHNVCSQCPSRFRGTRSPPDIVWTDKHQSPDGTRMFRSRADCGLDRYFPMVVEAIERAQLEQETQTDSIEGIPEAFGD